MTPEDADDDAYYAKQKADSEAFEDYCVRRVAERGVTIARHIGKQAQLRHGDTTLGIEIKYQARFAEFGALYIEMAEKRRRSSQTFIASGILSPADWRWMLTGSYRQVWLVHRTKLIEESRRATVKTTKRGTSRGFVLSVERMTQLASRVLEWPDTCHDGRPDRIDDEMVRDIGRTCFGIVYPGDVERKRA